MELLEAIRHRRTVKPFHMSPKPIDRELVMKLLDAGNWAPSHKNTQPWRFVIFDGDSRQQVVDTLVQTAGKGGVPLAPEDKAYQVMQSIPKSGAPVAVAILAKLKNHPGVHKLDEIMSVAMAVQNIKLAAHAEGLVSLWMSGHKVHHPKIDALVGAQKDEIKMLGFLWLGYPKNPLPEGQREPIEGRVRWAGAAQD